ncbi:universal stress protein [Fulvivirga sp.]|uniref:universal stress protein n=1 Tax=Fulvivirga sp. TaxID=1931237 RepID=UPI0032EE7756
MSKKLKIIFATDFTDAADNAIQYGIDFSKALAGNELECYLVHAYKHFVPYNDTPAIPVIENESLKEELKTRLAERSNELQELIDITPIFKRGNVTEVLEEIVADKAPDLIVMGTRERSAFERMTLGTHTAEVIKKVNCPVLAIPLEAEFKKLKKITFTADYEPLNIDYKSLVFIKDLARKEGSKFTVLHVFDSDEKDGLKEKMEKTALHRYFSDVDHDHQAVAGMNTIEGITRHIEHDQPDLIIAIPRHRNFIQEIFHSSISNELLYQTQVPILILIDR